MAKAQRKTPAKKAGAKGHGDSPAKRILLGGTFLVLAVLCAASLADYDPSQSPYHTTAVSDDDEAIDSNGTAPDGDNAIEEDLADEEDSDVPPVKKNQNLVGNVGVSIAFNSIYFFGNASWLIPLCLLWVSYMYWWRESHNLNKFKWISLTICLVSGAGICAMLTESVKFLSEFDPNYYTSGRGGVVGTFLFGKGVGSMGIGGTGLLLSVLFLAGLFGTLHDNLGRIDMIKQKLANKKEARQAAKEQLQKDKEAAEKKAKAAAKASAPSGIKKNRPQKTAPPPPIADEEEMMDAEPPLEEGGIDISKLKKSTPSGESKGLKLPSSKDKKAEKSKVPVVENLNIIEGSEIKKVAFQTPESVGSYQFPTLDLLSDVDEDSKNEPGQDHQAIAVTLVKTLSEFGVSVSMGDVHTGPVITRYDVNPAPGVRVEKILNLDKNIALGLKATSVRILAPVPGQGCVGIEVPNDKPLAVPIREILESENWKNSDAEIPIALGKEISGKPLIADLTKMPHLLIAGSTGSGKTVCINSIITSLLYHSSPETLRFVMVDPKVVEMQAFNALPHMLIPVVTNPKKVAGALKYLLKEMEERYQTFAELGVRNLAAYNKKCDEAGEPEGDAPTLKKMPYIVCIIDELADLMMVAPADIENGIARLTQLARAAGIHLIIATQRPSVNVITGVIKANLPSRISFKVASKMDSRVVLDSQGAEQLIGRGDMLFLPPGSSDLMRSQGAFVSDDDLLAIVDYLKQNGEPVFDEDFQKNIEKEEVSDGTAEEGSDELLPDALEVLRATKRASTSMLQRRLRIGYNRAARIMEIFEQRGIVGLENGSQPREILQDLDTVEL